MPPGLKSPRNTGSGLSARRDKPTTTGRLHILHIPYGEWIRRLQQVWRTITDNYSALTTPTNRQKTRTLSKLDPKHHSDSVAGNHFSIITHSELKTKEVQSAVCRWCWPELILISRPLEIFFVLQAKDLDVNIVIMPNHGFLLKPKHVA